MAKINIDHKHGLDMDQARQKLTDLAKQLEQKYRLRLSWSGDSVTIKGTGVKGDLTLAEGRLSGTLDVPFFIKGKVEKRLAERIHQEFPA